MEDKNLKKNKTQRKTLKYVTAVLSILFFVFGLISILQPESSELRILQIPGGDAIKWFALAIVIFLIPFLKEVSFNGNSVKLIDEIRETQKSVNEIKNQISKQKTKSRQELINAYSRYLKLLEEDERRIQVMKLNSIYFDEMNVDVKHLKKVLKSLDYNIDDESDEITLNLIKALEKFQIDKNLGGDGVFGYWTYDLIRPYFEKK